MTTPPVGLDDPTPAYDGGGLQDVLPSVCTALGVPDTRGRLDVPECRRAVVVLVDGLGEELLLRRGGHAPFLRSLLPTGRRLLSGFPSTTATSMGSFGTGLPPGAHGLVGYTVLVPEADRLLNELSWEDGPDPYLWQPRPTLFTEAEAAGVAVTRVGPGFFDGSGLTEAALRGGRFVAASSLPDRVDAALAALRRDTRSLVYLYWGEVDKVGHVRGPDSWQWGAEVESVDAELRRLAASVPGDTAVVVTADHGMISSPLDGRIDLAHDAELATGVRHAGGEPRALQLYCEPGAATDVLATWRARLGERAWIAARSEAESWFGGVEDRVRDRVGDIVVAMRGTEAIVDSRTQRQEMRSLIGLHGSLTPEELAIPFLVVPPREV
ncbi:MAG: alkaline phosphatase family protein [Mobilicoccus sp.]|nr:alkaline phosphatase family protein [Mobilicoccus sp.]